MESNAYPAGTQNNAEYLAPPPVEGVAGGGTGYGWNDVSLKGPCTLSKGIDPKRLPTQDLLHVWGMPSTATIGHQEPSRLLEPISMLVARNERESAQIALRPKVSWASGGAAGHVQVHCTDLCSSSGDRLEVGRCLTLRHVVPILGVPDALVPVSLPCARISLFPGETSAIWVSVDIPSAQPPGLYEGEILITAVKAHADFTEDGVVETGKFELRRELENTLAIAESSQEKPVHEMLEGLRAVTAGLQRLLQYPLLSVSGENGSMDMDEDNQDALAICVKLSVTVWDFVLPVTPSLPAVFGISETVIEDRFGLEHGSEAWYGSLDMHYKWLLQYRISPYFCRWGDNMRVLTYTCPWPADHPRAEEYYSDPRLAVYAVPYAPVLSSTYEAKDVLRKEIEILKTKAHWKKSYFYLWDEPLNSEQYDMIRSMSSEIRSLASDARVLTTYYCGPSDAPLAPGTFEAFVKVPNYLRPHTQIFCTSEWVLGNREDLVKDITAELQPENRAQILFGSCTIRYDINPFFGSAESPFSEGSPSPTTSAPPTVAHSPANKVNGTSRTISRKKSSKTLPLILGLVGGMILLLVICLIVTRKRVKSVIFGRPIIPVTNNQGRRGYSPQSGLHIQEQHFVFSLEALAEATDNFHDNNKLGEGGFGAVYKGTTRDGKEIAVKKLSARSTQGKKEFMNEVKLMANFKHRNLVKLLGCYAEGDERMLVYEYLRNKSLDFFLFDPEKRRELDWQKRYNIIIGIARGLLYLHEDSQLRIIHRDIKANNILLDDKLNPKIADFGLARLFPEDETHIQTRVAGTFGYMAPEYGMRGQLSVKADVYSFGVLLLEIVSGRKNTDIDLPQKMPSLLEWAWRLFKGGDVMDMVDSIVRETCPREKALRSIHVGLLCVQANATVRPAISNVIIMIASSSATLPNPTNPGFVSITESRGSKSRSKSSSGIEVYEKGTTSQTSEATTSSKSGAPSVNETSVTQVEAR